jgi:DNA-binding LacI/PurR family transcriptional regulator
VPGDLSVVGVDDHDLSATFGLTTVAQPVFEQGRLAAQLVLAAIGGDDTRRHEHVLMEIALVPRGTTAPVLPPAAVT